jgi:dihydroxyacetone kinase-like predicted kinase
MGVAEVVDGGQTNNPSTEEILTAVRATGTNRVIILPNNKNIVLTAEQAARAGQGVQIKIVPSVSFPQGIAAMLAYRPDGDFEEILAGMMTSKNAVVTVEVTTATRSVELDGVAVKTGQCIALVNGKLRVAGDRLSEVARRALDEIDMDDYSVITLYYGAEVTPEAAEALAESLSSDFPDHEISAVYGGQPHYYYIVGIE